MSHSPSCPSLMLMDTKHGSILIFFAGLVLLLELLVADDFTTTSKDFGVITVDIVVVGASGADVVDFDFSVIGTNFATFGAVA